MQAADVARPLAASAMTASWLDRCMRLRDRLFASPGFRQWATGFPLTRPIARRRARDLFDLCAGFVYSQILLACVQLRLFETLLPGPLGLEELSGRLGLDRQAATRLLAAAAALALVEYRRDGRYGMGVLGADLLANPGVMAMVEHHRLLYADLADPVALLRGERAHTELGRYWAYAGSAAGAELSAECVEAYSALMSQSQPMVAAEILAAYPLRRHKCLLDVGGGEGGFLIAAAASAPGLRLQLFDLPAVADRARARLAAEGLTGRASVVGGDFLIDPLPTGADVISLVRVLHDHDDASVVSLLQAARAALPPTGTMLIAEPLAGTPGAEPVGDAYFGFYLLAMGRGRPRTEKELAGLLRSAGFTRVRSIPTRMPLLTSLLSARW